MSTSTQPIAIEEGTKFGPLPTFDLDNASPLKRKARDMKWSKINFTVNKKVQVLKDCWGEVS